MAEWIAKYWLEVVFGLILAFMAWGGKKLIHFYIQEMKKMLKDTEDKIISQLQAKDQEQDQKMDELRAGLLSVQGQGFKDKCHKLLSPDHSINVEELEIITRDHDAYKGLGGNHEGDALFTLVMEKAKKDITQ